MTCSRRTVRAAIDVNDPFTHLVYATKQLEGKISISDCVGIVGLGYPIFNVRSEYDKLDEYDGQVGREA